MKNKAQNILILFTLIFSGCSVFATDLSDSFSIADDLVAHVDEVKSLNTPVEGDCSVDVITTEEELQRVNPLVEALADKNVLKKFKQKINDLQVEEVLKRLSAMNAVGDLKEQISKAEVELLEKQLQGIKKKINKHNKSDKHDKGDKKGDELYITMFLRSCILNPIKDSINCAWGVTKNIMVSYIVAIVILSVIAEVLPIGPGELFGYFGVNMWSVLYTGFYTVPVGILAMIFGALFGGVAPAADAVVCNPWADLFSFGYVCL